MQHQSNFGHLFFGGRGTTAKESLAGVDCATGPECKSTPRHVVTEVGLPDPHLWSSKATGARFTRSRDSFGAADMEMEFAASLRRCSGASLRNAACRHRDGGRVLA